MRELPEPDGYIGVNDHDAGDDGQATAGVINSAIRNLMED